jgi:hypothetical protein
VANGFLSVTIQDSVGVKATHVINLQLIGTQTVDDVGAEFNTYLPLLDAVTDGKILSATFNWEVDLPGGLKANPVAKSTVSRGLLQGWTQAIATAKRAATLVPALILAMISATTGKLDTTNAAYLAWRGHLLGLTGPAIKFVSEANYQITGSIDVREVFRKHRKRTAELTETAAP